MPATAIAPKRTRTALPMAPQKPEPYTGPSKAEVLALRKQYLSPGLLTYYQDPLLIVEGKMQYLWDETGKQYLDAFAGIVTVSVGHCHPYVVDRVQRAGRHDCNMSTTIYLHPTIGQLGKKLADHMPADSGLSSSYFTNSGSEANEVGHPDGPRVHGNVGSHFASQRLPRRHRRRRWA